MNSGTSCGVEPIAELLAGTVFNDGVPAPVDETEQQQSAALSNPH